MSEVSTELAETIKSNYKMMETVANNSQSLDDIKNLTSSKVTDQLKVFLIAQARNELTRVLKLTEFLDKLENSFMSKVNEAMIDDSLTLRQYSDVISVITSLLSRSNDIISKVLKDDSLSTIINTTIYSDTTSVTSVASLRDSQSRERVRSVIQTILYKTENYQNTIVESED